MGWTEDEEKRLIELVNRDELSAKEIAEQHFPGKSREAILGKMHRIRQRGEGELVSKAHRVTDYKPRPRRFAFSKPDVRMVGGERMPPLRLSLADVLDSGGCKWPVNDRDEDGEHLFCGQPAAPGRCYCLHHATRGRAR